MSTMVDGTGTTSYAYGLVSAQGAGQALAVDGPLTSDTIVYTYDQLGRMASRTLDGITSAWTYDAFGRVATIVDPLGTFTYTYDGAIRTGELHAW